MNWDTLVLVITSIGGFEAIKWLINWFFNKENNIRLSKAQADQAEASADHGEWELMEREITFLQEQLIEKERRFAEQTELLRATNRALLDAEKKVTALEAERELKLCERRGCRRREPQSGY